MENQIENISLSELSVIEGLSIRIQNTLKCNGLTEINSILNYYYEFNNFFGLMRCGIDTNLRLIELCEKYKNFISKTKINQKRENFEINIDLKELSLIEGLSVRSQNICEDHNLNDLVSLLNYYWEFKTFEQLRNCGRLTNIELTNICLKYQNNINQPPEIIQPPPEIIEAKPINPIFDKIDSLTEKQKKLIINLFESDLNTLSVRSSNVLKEYINSSIDTTGIKLILSFQENEIRNLRNVGELSGIEINAFLNSLKEQIEFVYEITDDSKMGKELLITFFKKTFNPEDEQIEKIINGYDFSTGLPIFKIIKGLIDKSFILRNLEKKIFYNEYSVPDNEIKTPENLAYDLGISKERVRQIKCQFLQRFDNDFRFIIQNEIKSLVNYGMDLNENYLEISDDFVCHINASEGTEFSRLFITKIIALLYSDKYQLIGLSDQKSDSWKRCYIINRNLTAVFDFDRLIDDIQSRLSGRIEEDYTLYFQSYLLDFMKIEGNSLINSIVETAEYILFDQFELSLNSDECIVFSKNTKMQVIDCINEALKESKKPLTVYELYEIIEKKYPGITKSAESLRGSCQRDPNLIFFGRTSTYGLKIWENDSDVKGGTIRSIVEEYLSLNDYPKHINEITEYVNKFRNTNPINIIANLKLDGSGKLVFFNQSFVGLAEKKFNKEYLPYENIPKFLGKSIISMVVKKGAVDFGDLVNYFSSRISIPEKPIEIIIKHLIEVHNLTLNNSLITGTHEN